MPTWLRWLSTGNPLSYEVEALRGMLLGIPARLPLDFAVLVAAVLVGVTTAASLLPRLAR
jgi:ABC-2 type transport system permease protein